MNIREAAFKREQSRASVSTETIRSLHASGMSCREIGRRTGVSASSIQRRLARVGVRRRKDDILGRYGERLASAAESRRLGFSYAFCAEQLGVKSASAARKILNQWSDPKWTSSSTASSPQLTGSRRRSPAISALGSTGTRFW